jgi:hypothetical protein
MIEDEAFEAESVTVRPKAGAVYSCEHCTLDGCILHSPKFSYLRGFSTDDVTQTTSEGLIEDEAFEAESVTVRPKAGMISG